MWIPSIGDQCDRSNGRKRNMKLLLDTLANLGRAR